MRRAIARIFLCFLFSISTFAVASANYSDPFTRDILILTDWFEGEFDNEEQQWFHRRSRAEGEMPVRVHTIHKRLDLPVFGDHVFYVEEYKDNDPTDIIRQRLVVFSSDLEENAIRVKQGFFKKPDAVRGGHNDPKKLKKLKPKDVFFMDECDVFMRRNASQFEGGMKPKACVFGEGEKRRYSVHNMTVSEKKFWRVDATFLVANNSFHAGTPLNKPTELRRARIYSCDFYFYGGEGLGQERTQQSVEDLRVHSQGGSATVTRESDGAQFEIFLREKEYPYYETRPDFIYYSLRRSGEKLKSIAYGVADADSRQFGLNQGEMGTFCHQEGYNFRELVEQL